MSDKLEANDLVKLSENYSFLKDLEMAIQNIFNTNQGIVYSNREKKTIAASFFKMKNTDELDKKINDIIKSNNQLFEKYVTNN